MTETTQVCLVAYEAISADVAPGKRVFLFIRRAGRRDWAANLSSGSFESISIGVFFDRYMVRKQKFGICVCSSLMTCAAGLCRASCEVQRCHAQCRFDKRTVRQSLSGLPVARPIVIGVAGSEGLTRERDFFAVLRGKIPGNRGCNVCYTEETWRGLAFFVWIHDRKGAYL